VSKTVWVDGGGMDGDDTDGHIDQLARFVSPGVVVVAVSTSPDDSNHAGLAANFDILSQARDAQGDKLTVHRLPTPLPRLVDGRRVPESYCNFLIANGIVIVPTFRSPTDDPALRLLEQLMPDRRIVPLDAFDLIWGLGAFHCASQQQPAAAFV
jgi:agmatine deiminase